MNIGLKKAGGGSGDVGLVHLRAGYNTQVELDVAHPAGIKSLTLEDRGDMTLDLSALTSLKTFIQDNGGGSYLQSFPIFPTSIESIQARGSGYYFQNLDASALVNLTVLDWPQAGQIGANSGTISLPNTTKLKHVNFGACNLTTAQIDALLIWLAAHSDPTGCNVFVDGPGNGDPSPGDRSSTGAVVASDWTRTEDGTYGHVWSATVDSTTYYLFKVPYANWVITTSMTPDYGSDPYWQCANFNSIGTYNAVNQTADDIVVDFDAGASGMKAIFALIAAGGSVTYNSYYPR